MIIYFDTETTGLTPGKIIQLAYVKEEKHGVTGKNFYCYTDYIEPAAQATHGISVEALEKLSGGKLFCDYVDEIAEDFLNAELIVAHNFAFDFSFMLEEFKNAGRAFRYKESFDTMKYFTPIMKLPRRSGRGYKYPSLSELSSYAGVGESASGVAESIFGKGCGGYHNACFDTATTYLAVKELRKGLSELNEYLSRKI